VHGSAGEGGGRGDSAATRRAAHGRGQLRNGLGTAAAATAAAAAAVLVVASGAGRACTMGCAAQHGAMPVRPGAARAARAVGRKAGAARLAGRGVGRGPAHRAGVDVGAGGDEDADGRRVAGAGGNEDRGLALRPAGARRPAARAAFVGAHGAGRDWIVMRTCRRSESLGAMHVQWPTFWGE
jgi:hypothetical protein